MRLLKDVWAAETIGGSFKGSMNDFLFKSLDEGKEIFDGPRKLTSIFEAMTVDPSKLFYSEAKETLNKKSGLDKSASLKKADVYFNPSQQVTKCPHCDMGMRKAKLGSGLGVIYCPNCRHADYDENVKSSLNAGAPSVDKSLQLKFTDSGNCQII